MGMLNKVVVITGASSGIGQAAAETLAKRGARIVQIARDHTRGEAALKRLREIAPKVDHALYRADLSLMSEAKRVGLDIARAEPRIDVLINNAGAIFNARQVTAEGLERTFALNHMAYFVLTCQLLEHLRRSAPARIVNTASDAHESAVIDFDDLQSARLYPDSGLRQLLRQGGPGFQVYARSKLCNILFTRALAKRLGGTGVTANCVHPGFVATRFGNESGGRMAFSLAIAKRFARSIDKGAETLVYLASAPEVADVTGEYFADCRVAAMSDAARDDGAADRLWNESNRLADLRTARA